MKNNSEQKLLRRNVRLLYISYFIVFALTLLVESIGSYIVIKQVVYSSSRDMVTEFSLSLEEKLQTGVNLAIEIGEDYGVQRMALQTKFDYAAWQIGQSSLNKYTSIYNRISSIYVYNASLNRVYSSTAVPGNDNLSIPLDSFSDQGVLDMIKDVYSYPIYTPIPRVAHFSDGSSRCYYTFIGFNAISHTDSTGKAIELSFVNIAADSISMLTPQLSLSGEIVIVDQSGRTVSNTDRYPMMTDLSSEPFFSEIAWEESGDMVTEIGGEKFYIACSLPQRYGWKYYWLIPYTGIVTLMYQFWVLTAIIGGVLCFITFVVISRLTFSINHPIRVIQEGLARSKKTLEQVTQEQRENYYDLRQSFLQELLSGKMLPASYYNNQTEKYDFHFPFDRRFYLILFRVARRNDFMRSFNVREQSALLFSACNIVQELMEKDFCVESIRLSKTGQFICLVSPIDLHTNVRDVLYRLLPDIQQNILSILELSVYCSVSEKGYKLSDLPILYRQVVETDRYHLLTGVEDILFYSDCVQRERNIAIYPENEYKKFQSALRDGYLNTAKVQFTRDYTG